MPQSCPIDIGVALTSYQAIGIHTPWVILGLEREYRLLGYNIPNPPKPPLKTINPCEPYSRKKEENSKTNGPHKKYIRKAQVT